MLDCGKVHLDLCSYKFTFKLKCGMIQFLRENYMCFIYSNNCY